MSSWPPRLRSCLGLLPLGVVGLVTAAAWGVFQSGGTLSLFGWLALLLLVPALAVLLLLGTAAYAAWRRRGGRRLLATTALTAFCVWPVGWMFGVAPIPYPYDLASTTPAVTTRLPTDASMLVLWGGDDLEHNAHASTPDQRWAYDLLVEPAQSGSARLEDYGCWGVPVVAPIAGTVRVAHDGEVDQIPGVMSRELKSPAGNHVAIALDGGGYLVVAHLQNGSVRAREGERVEEGAVLGACGNSGHSSEPHVHIHAQRQDPKGRPVGFAEGLPLFFRDHDGAPMPLGGERTIVRHIARRAPSAEALGASQANTTSPAPR